MHYLFFFVSNMILKCCCFRLYFDMCNCEFMDLYSVHIFINLHQVYPGSHNIIFKTTVLLINFVVQTICCANKCCAFFYIIAAVSFSESFTKYKIHLYGFRAVIFIIWSTLNMCIQIMKVAWNGWYATKISIKNHLAVQLYTALVCYFYMRWKGLLGRLKAGSTLYYLHYILKVYTSQKTQRWKEENSQRGTHHLYVCV